MQPRAHGGGKRKQEDKENTSGVMSHDDMKKVHKKLHGIRDGNWRFPWLGGGTEFFTLMKPGEDPIEDKLFNFFAVLNIYSGLLASGLIGYVLEVQGDVEGDCELTGTTRQEVVYWQTLLAHVNLVVSVVMFAFTTYMGLFAAVETPHTIVRCVSNSGGLWVYMFMTFFQMFLLVGQTCIAAILNLDPEWAKVAIGLDVGIFFGLVVFSQHLMGGPNGMFPLGMQDWLILCPTLLLQYLVFGRQVPNRIGDALVADAGHLDIDSDELNDKSSFEANEQQQHLRDFIESIFHGKWHEDRVLIVVEAMLKEDLTVDRLVSMASIPSGPVVLFQALDLETVELKRGERFDMITAASNHSVCTPTSDVGFKGIDSSGTGIKPQIIAQRGQFASVLPNQVALA